MQQTEQTILSIIPPFFHLVGSYKNITFAEVAELLEDPLLLHVDLTLQQGLAVHLSILFRRGDVHIEALVDLPQKLQIRAWLVR